ncbi:MAG TPA: rhomboid family intramembrane serine protease [candidate division Zixibacteria bacterium]|nr:rhomboid family intramembrane serine protease [candidate division Zixibacteria bacterium]
MFIPIRDDIPTYHKPVLTVTLIVINTLVFLYAYSLGSRGFQIFTFQYGYIPYELISSVELTPQIAVPVWLTPFTSMFMHGGWLHLIGNMLFLWIYGNNIEDYLGKIGFVVFYLFSGLAAITLYTVFGPHSEVPLIGASGAIAGVMGAYMVLHPQARITILFVFFFIQFIQLPAKVVLGIWFAYQILMSIMDSATGGGVAWMAHVGGFGFGWVVMKIIVKIRGPHVRTGNGQRIYRMNW